MRASTIILSLAAAVSAQNMNDFDLSEQDLENLQGMDLDEALASITTDPAYSSIVQQIATADPQSLYESVASLADQGLASLSAQAATATGEEGEYLSGLYTSATAALSSYDALVTPYLNGTAPANGTATTTTGGSSPTTTVGGGSSDDSDSDSDSDSSDASGSQGVESQTDSGAMATAVPVAFGALGMAVLGML